MITLAEAQEQLRVAHVRNEEYKIEAPWPRWTACSEATRGRFLRRGLPVPDYLAKRTHDDAEDDGPLGPSETTMREKRLARLEAMGYPKRTTYLGCGRPMMSKYQGRGFHTSCRVEAHTFTMGVYL